MKIKTDRVTLVRLIDRYDYENELRPMTLRNYRSIIKRLENENQVRYMAEVSDEVVCRWKNEVVQRVSAITWNNYRNHMRALWNFGIEKGWVDKNVFAHSKKVPTPKLKKKTIEISQLAIMLDLIDHKQDQFDPPWFWKAVMHLYFYTGMRRKQLVALRWEDIDLKKKTIFLSLAGSKTHREWEIPLPAGCYGDLCILKRQSEQKYGTANFSKQQVFRLQLFNKN